MLFKNIRRKKTYPNPVVEMICGNLDSFGLHVDEAKTAVDFQNGEVYNLIQTGHTVIKMVPNREQTAFTTFIDTLTDCETREELARRLEEFIKAYISVLFIHTVLLPEDIEAIKNLEMYNKNGIRSVLDRKSDSIYVTIFDSNNRLNNNLLSQYN